MRTSRFLVLLSVMAVLPAAVLPAADPPPRRAQVIVIARTEGERPDPQLQSVIADSIQQELQRAGFLVQSEPELRRRYFPQGLPEFSRTVLLQELARRTDADFLLEAVFASLEDGVRLDCYLSDLYSRELIGKVTRSREVDLMFDQMVNEEMAELTPLIRTRLATLPPPEERRRQGGVLGMGQVPPAGPTAPPPAPDGRPAPGTAAPGAAEPAGPAAAAAPPAAATPPATPSPTSPLPSPSGPPVAREPGSRTAGAFPLPGQAPLPWSLGAGFAPFIPGGEAAGYFQMGYMASLYGSYRLNVPGRFLGVGFLLGANLFQVGGTDNLLLPFGPDLRFIIGGQRFNAFAHVSGGPSVITVDLGGSEAQSKFIPYALAGAGLQLSLLRRLSLTADVSYVVFFEKLFPIMGLAPSVYLTLNL